MSWLGSIPNELAITASDPHVWVAIALALLLGAVALLFGTWLTRAVGLLDDDAPGGETLGVGLGSGLLVLAAWWAALWSGARSSFTPVAIGFAVALGLALVRRARRRRSGRVPNSGPVQSPGPPDATVRPKPRRSLGLAVLCGGVFVVAVALSYGATVAPSPRAGVQPIEYRDQAFYAVLSQDLATSGTEASLPVSGFPSVPGLPTQTWYHWGELWLAAAVITVFGVGSMAARYFVVLPLALLAAAALSGTVVRRLTGTSSKGAYLLGFIACLFLAPVPLLPGPFFSSWATGLLSGIIVFGLAPIPLLLALYGLAVLRVRTPDWSLTTFAGTAATSILPAHIVIAVLALVGVGVAWAIRLVGAMVTTRRLPSVPLVWQRTIGVTAIALVATFAWGTLTDHGLGAGSIQSNVAPFNGSWRDSLALVALGAGVFFAIPLAWVLDRRRAPLRADLYLGTLALLAFGAIAWGARLGDFNMFYFFFGGVAVIATPVAAVALRTVWERLHASGHRFLAAGVVVLFVVQLAWALVTGVVLLERRGPEPGYPPVPVALLEAIKSLPAGAKIAYACQPFEEYSFVNSALVAIDAHTGRAVVPMCYEAESLDMLVGAVKSPQIMSAGFAWAPQRVLYPNASAHPSPAAVAAFLASHGIDYIYADGRHPNTLVPAAMPIATSGAFQLLKVP